jgi:hypothetical protein
VAALIATAGAFATREGDQWPPPPLAGEMIADGSDRFGGSATGIEVDHRLPGASIGGFRHFAYETIHRSMLVRWSSGPLRLQVWPVGPKARRVLLRIECRRGGNRAFSGQHTVSSPLSGKGRPSTNPCHFAPHPNIVLESRNPSAGQKRPACANSRRGAPAYRSLGGAGQGAPSATPHPTTK